MKDKEKTEEDPIFQTVDEAMKTYDQMLRAQWKFQEKAWQCWSEALNQPVMQGWQKSFAQAVGSVSGTMPKTEERMEETFEMAKKNSRASADLIKKALEASQTSSISESQSKWTEVFMGSMDLTRANAQAMIVMNSRAVESWATMVQKNSDTAKGQATKAL